jgi:starch synthase
MPNTRAGWVGIKACYIPRWDSWKRGMLEWEGNINPLASAVKNAWKVTTVSWSYMEELRYNSNGLEALFEYEKGNVLAFLNGIDADVWDPATDKYIDDHFSEEDVDEGKLPTKNYYAINLILIYQTFIHFYWKTCW